MSVEVLYTTHAMAEKLVAAAHQVCPHSNATRGNIDVGLEVAVVRAAALPAPPVTRCRRMSPSAT